MPDLPALRKRSQDAAQAVALAHEALALLSRLQLNPTTPAANALHYARSPLRSAMALLEGEAEAAREAVDDELIRQGSRAEHTKATNDA